MDLFKRMTPTLSILIALSLCAHALGCPPGHMCSQGKQGGSFSIEELLKRGNEPEPPSAPTAFLELLRRPHARALLSRRLQSPTDPCAALDATLLSAYSLPSESLAFVRPSQVRECSRQRVPFDRATALQDLQSVSNYLRHFYSLIHLAKASPDPTNHPIQWDVLAELEKLRTQTWTYAEDFYSALVRTIDNLHDAHTGIGYTPNVPTVFRLALPLVGLMDGGQPTVRIVPSSMAGTRWPNVASQAPFSFQASRFFGARVLQIDGRPAWQSMLDWATQNSGGWLSVGQRLNNAFARFTYNNYRQAITPGAFAARAENPGADFVTMVLQRVGESTSETVQVPWIAAVDLRFYPFSRATRRLVPNSLPNSVSRDKGAWGQAPAPTQNSGSATGGPVSPSQKPWVKKEKVPERFRFEPAPGLTSQPVTNGGVGKAGRAPTANMIRLSNPQLDLWEVFRLADNRTCVLAFTDFVLADRSGNPLSADYFAETRKAFQTIIRNGCTQVLIDLTGNGGGFTMFGSWLIQWIVGADSFSRVAGGLESDYWRFLADTTLVTDLVRNNAGLFSYAQWANSREQAFSWWTARSFFNPTTKAAFGSSGVTGTYSNSFKDRVNLGRFRIDPRRPGLGSIKIMLLSNGLCYSTCGTVAHTLKRRFGIPLVTVGGAPSTPLAFSGGGGGFVTGNAEGDLLGYFPRAVAARVDAPKRLSRQMGLAMRLAAGFYDNTLTNPPLEYTFLPGDRRVFYTPENVADPSRLYLDAAALFQ